VLEDLGRATRSDRTRVAVLVGCGKAKSDEAAPARDLYTSPLFRKSVELGELLGDAVFVVSAAKGLVELDTPITPYEVNLRAFDREMREEWAVYVLKDLSLHAIGSSPSLRVVLLMGATYADPLLAEIAKASKRSTAWAPPVDIMRGLQIGDRLAFLNRAIPLARGAR